MEDMKDFTSLEDFPMSGTPNAFNDENYFNLGTSTPRDFNFTYNYGTLFAMEDVETPSASLPSIFPAQQDGTIEPNATWNTSMPNEQLDLRRNNASYHELNASAATLNGVDFLNAAPSQMPPSVTSNPEPVTKQPQQEPSSSTKSTRTQKQSSSAPSSNESDAQSSRGKRNATAEENCGPNDAAPPKKRQRRARKKGPEPTKEELERKKEAFLERNRQAASRCRQKKKVEHGSLEERARQMKHERDFNQSIVNQLLEERERLREMVAAHADCPELRQWLDGQDMSLTSNIRPRPAAAAVDSPLINSPLTLVDPALQSENSPDEREPWLQSMSPVAMSRTNSNNSTHNSRHAISTGRHNSVGNNSIMAQQNAAHKRNNSMPAAVLQRVLNLAPYPVPTEVSLRDFTDSPSFSASNLNGAASFVSAVPHRDSAICLEQLNIDGENDSKTRGDVMMKALHSPQIHAAMAAAPRAAMAD